MSITTVSHALNGKAGVSEETRRRVREVADQLGYRPDPRGRHLASGRTGLIALTVSMPDGVHAPVEEFEHNANLIDAATATAIARGLALVIVPAGEASIWERLPLDGLIVVDPVPDDPAIRELDRSVPIVTVGKVPGGRADTWVVDNDYAAGTAAILDHMVASGARRVGMLSLTGGESYELDSLGAYRAWCERRGVEPWIHAAKEADWTSPDTWDRLESISRSAAASCLDRPHDLVARRPGARGTQPPGDHYVGALPPGPGSGRGRAARPRRWHLARHRPVVVPTTVVARASTARE